LGRFYKCQRFSDVVLIDAAGNKISAHRLVLSARSKIFNDLLSRDRKSELHCTDVEPSCLHLMLEYLYTNQCQNIQLHNAVQLLSTALLYGCDDLESMASLYIHMHLDANSCCFFFSEAQKHKVEHIAIKALYVASMAFDNVIQSQSFYDLNLDNLTAMLGSPKLGSIPKVVLYKAGCLWMAKNPSGLEKFQDLLVCIQTRPSSNPDLDLANYLAPSQSRSSEEVSEVEWPPVPPTTVPPSILTQSLIRLRRSWQALLFRRDLRRNRSTRKCRLARAMAFLLRVRLEVETCQ